MPYLLFYVCTRVGGTLLVAFLSWLDPTWVALSTIKPYWIPLYGEVLFAYRRWVAPILPQRRSES